MMFVILTHHNQSIRLSFSELLSFVTNSPVAEEALSSSTDKTHLVYHNLWLDLFLCRNSFVVFTLKDYVDSVLYFKWLIKRAVLEVPTFV